MLSELWKVAKTIVTLADDLQKYHAEIRDIREELMELTIVVNSLSKDLTHAKEQLATEHARHLTEIELRLERAGRALPPAKKTGRKLSKRGSKK